jgi:hypothetical protein
MRVCRKLFSLENKKETLTKGEVMKRLVMVAAIVGSAFIFTSCATNNDNGEQASNTQQASPYAPPINSPVMDDSGYNRWPETFRYQYQPGTDASQ